MKENIPVVCSCISYLVPGYQVPVVSNHDDVTIIRTHKYSVPGTAIYVSNWRILPLYLVLPGTRSVSDTCMAAAGGLFDPSAILPV